MSCLQNLSPCWRVELNLRSKLDFSGHQVERNSLLRVGVCFEPRLDERRYRQVPDGGGDKPHGRLNCRVGYFAFSSGQGGSLEAIERAFESGVIFASIMKD